MAFGSSARGFGRIGDGDEGYAAQAAEVSASPGDDAAVLREAAPDLRRAARGPAEAPREIITVAAVAANVPPVVDLNGEAVGTSTSVAYVENDNAVLLAPGATVSDADSQNFLGGSLRVEITAGRTAADQLLITPAGFFVEESTLYYNGEAIGTVQGGIDGSPLVITFTELVTPALAQELVRAIGFANSSEAPVAGSRTITFTLSDGDGGTSVPATAQVEVTSVDDEASAAPDSVNTAENLVLNGSVFADNGFGEDTDPDGTIQVTAVNGETARVGQTFELESGAKLRLNADGTFSYDPNGRFNSLPSTGSGAANSSTTDTFQYTITGGATTTVTVTVEGIESQNDQFAGDAEDNVITGTPFRDVMRVEQGGKDDVRGLAGNDTFYFGAEFNALDKVDGGTGIDSIILQGDYSAGLTFGTGTTSNIAGVETVSLVPGHFTDFGGSGEAFYSYSLIMLDANVAAGATFKVNGFYLRETENFTFNGVAEGSGRFILLAGQGVDDLTGGGGNDIFVFGHDGRFGLGDAVEGGGGYDSIYLRGDYALDFLEAPTGTFRGIESITLGWAADDQFVSGGDGEFDYDIVWADEMLDDGVTVTVNGSGLAANETMIFDGGDESDGRFRLFGGAAADSLTGGEKDDLIYGGLGADDLEGGLGADRYVYYAPAESTDDGFDTIFGFEHGVDLIDLSVIDADSRTAANEGFTFVGAAPLTGAGQLRAERIGVETNLWRIEADVTGDGEADFVLEVLVGGTDALTSADFVF